MSDPRGWEVLENVKNPICPLISALTFKQSNKYVECVKEKCMWWSKCKGLKEARPHGEWIPVSERLPEENKTVIASTKYGVFPEAIYTKEDGWAWAFESGADYWEELEGVTAWMPLPEPYKEEGEAE